MAIYAECPSCHRKQSTSNELCRKCGFELIKARKKNGVPYWVYLRYRGRQVWKRIGCSLTVARTQEADLRAKLVKDEYTPPEKATKLNDFFTKNYLPWAKREKRSADKDESRFSNHILPFFGNCKIKDIKPARIEEFKTLRTGEGSKNATVNRDLALLKTVFNKAKRWGLYKGDNPVSACGMLPENNEHVARCLSDDELAKLLPELPGETKAIFEFAVASGLRIGNIYSLQWSMVDRRNRVITLPKTKNGRPLMIPLNDWANSILDTIPRHARSPYVFCRLDGKPYRNCTRGFKNALARAKLDTTYRIHDLRHTFATRLAIRGVPTGILKDLMGHSSLQMVQRYSHIGQQTLLEMSNRVSAPFGKQSNQCANNAPEGKK